MFKKLLSILFASLFLSASAMAQANSEQVILKAGTPISMEITQRVSSNSFSEGTAVNFVTTADVLAGGKVVIPVGTLVKGTVCQSSHSTILGIPGKIGVTVEGVYAADGTYVPITGGGIYDEGDDNIALAVLCGLFTVVGFIINGEPAVIPAGTAVQGIVLANTVIDAVAASAFPV